MEQEKSIESKRSLSGKQVRYLRSLGHHLKPVVLIGKEGVSLALTESVGESLEQHELIKVKLLDTCPVDRKHAAGELSRMTQAETIQVLGRTILLYRRAKSPRITLP